MNKPHKFDRMARRLAATVTCAGRWGKIAVALRHLDMKAETRGYFKGIAFSEMVHRNRKSGIRKWKP